MNTDIATAGRFARARAARIREGIHGYLSTLTMIAEAWREEDWRTLRYPSWAAYVDGEFGAERLRLPAEHRRKAIEELRLAGMGARAIATAIGVDRETVTNDIRESRGAGIQPPGIDDKTYSGTRPPAVTETTEPEEAGTPLVEAMTEAVQKTAKRVAEPNVVDRMLAEDPDVQAADFLHRFAGALVKAGVVYEFPADRVGALADERLVESLEHHAELVVKYAAEVRRHRPSRLRLVKEA